MASKGLSGNKETDFLILMQLTDYELTKVCQVNKYVNKLCNDDNFWRNRVLTKFGYPLDILNYTMRKVKIKTYMAKENEAICRLITNISAV